MTGLLHVIQPLHDRQLMKPLIALDRSAILILIWSGFVFRSRISNVVNQVGRFVGNSRAVVVTRGGNEIFIILRTSGVKACKFEAQLVWIKLIREVVLVKAYEILTCPHTDERVVIRIGYLRTKNVFYSLNNVILDSEVQVILHMYMSVASMVYNGLKPCDFIPSPFSFFPSSFSSSPLFSSDGFKHTWP